MSNIPQDSKQLTKILIVDDDDAQLLALEKMLSGLDIEICKAFSGRNAVSLAKSYEFALILLDIMMQEMDGFQTAELIRYFGKSQKSPIVFITAFAAKENQMFKGYDVGAVDYLIKPVSSEILRSKVKVFVELFQQKELINHQKEFLEQTLIEKETLLREIHHRVKNNMSVITSLLALQEERVTDSITKDILRDSQNRVQTMATIHETLYQTDNLSSVDMNDYLSQLGGFIFQGYNRSDNIDLIVDAKSVMMDPKQASSVGLIVNELISNTLKYAFPDERQGQIVIIVKLVNEREAEMTYSDNGHGIPEDFDLNNSNSLGLKLVKMIAENQLDGSIDMKSIHGTKFSIKFNIEA